MAAVILILMITIWSLFAPTQFGGQTSYVMVAGASMEPTYYRGDLVVVRSEEAYSIGDVVTYNHPTLGPIIHRIVDKHGDDFVFKGDNNRWLDSHPLPEKSIIGKATFHLKDGATYLEKVRDPSNLSVFTFSTFVFLMVVGLKKKGSELSSRLPSASMTIFQSKISENVEGFLYVFGALSIGFLLLTIVAFTNPLTTLLPDAISYDHAGEFKYFAHAPGDVYEENFIRTGDPIFRNLVNEFGIDFEYELFSSAPEEIMGSHRLDLEIRDVSGWSRTLVLQPETPFKGSSLTTSGTILIYELQKIINSLEQKTGLHRTFYEIVVIPTVSVEGLLGGRIFKDSFSPQLTFQLDDVQLQLIRNNDPLSEIDPLLPSSMGSVERAVKVDETLNLLGVKIPVRTARWISTIGLLVTLGFLGIIGYELYDSMQSGGSRQIKTKYAPKLVSIEMGKQLMTGKVIDVSNIDDLAKIATNSQRMILHINDGKTQTYIVQASEVTYRYVTTDEVRDGETEFSEKSTKTKKSAPSKGSKK